MSDRHRQRAGVFVVTGYGRGAGVKAVPAPPAPVEGGSVVHQQPEGRIAEHFANQTPPSQVAYTKDSFHGCEFLFPCPLASGFFIVQGFVVFTVF